MFRFELVMIHICNDGYLLRFYLNITLTSLDTVWIMFKKGFVLYREVIQIVIVMQVLAS
jgi:hypothetical protein